MKKVIAALAIGIIGFFTYSAVKPSNKPVKTGTGVVYYYPKPNVYYDVATGQYVYFESETKTWKQTRNFNEEQKLSLGEKAIISKPSSPIWKNNADDRIIYSVNLYASRYDLKQKFYADSLNSLPKIAATPAKVIKPDEKIEEEKPKSGFRKFFEKIFKSGKDQQKES